MKGLGQSGIMEGLGQSKVKEGLEQSEVIRIGTVEGSSAGTGTFGDNGGTGTV